MDLEKETTKRWAGFAVNIEFFPFQLYLRETKAGQQSLRGNIPTAEFAKVRVRLQCKRTRITDTAELSGSVDDIHSGYAAPAPADLQ